MRKFIFLDIDGVLATTYDDRSVYPDHGYGFDPEPMKNLDWLCRAVPDCVIVISSTWRLGKDVAMLQEIFRVRGFQHIMKIIDRTDRLDYSYIKKDGTSGSQGMPRGVEIYHWLRQNINVYDESYAYVILDDDGDMMYWQKENFIKTKGDVGLTLKQAQKAARILNTDANVLYKTRKLAPPIII